jgi:hypothetical protein
VLRYNTGHESLSTFPDADDSLRRRAGASAGLLCGPSGLLGDLAGRRHGGHPARRHRDDIAFNLIENDNREWIENSSFSIGVSDLDALYEEYRDLPTNVGPLEVKFWGRREFHMIVPSGVCLQFYQQDHG